MPNSHTVSPVVEAARGRKQFVRMFQKRFEAAIVSGMKPHTVRRRPMRMPEPGDRLSCRVWEGLPYRSPQREILLVEVEKVEDFLLMRMPEGDRMRVGLKWLDAAEAEEFAQADGFVSFVEMREWFERTHDLKRGPYEGIVLHWKPLTPCPAR